MNRLQGSIQEDKRNHGFVYRLHKERELTTILVTHSMEDAAKYADQISIMHEGRCVRTGTPREIFSDSETLKKYRLEVPRIVNFQQKIEKLIGTPLSKICLTEEELAEEIARVIKERDR